MLHRTHNLTIEKIRYQDLNELEDIFTAAFGDELDTIRIQHRLHRMRQFYFLLRPLSTVSPWVRNMFNIFICRVNNDVAGFVQVSCINPRQMHLDYIALSKRYRGQGLGTLILQRLLTKVAQRNYDIVLEVRIDNPAYHLYKRLGFKEQAQIIHYQRSLTDLPQVVAPVLPNLRPVRSQDWLELYQLYLRSLPAKLHRVVKRDWRDFKPNYLTTGLEWIKGRLMRTKKRHYVLTQGEAIIGSLEINSFHKTNSHSLNILLEPDDERWREPLIRHALYLLQSALPGTVSTTIYNDDPRKQHTLEKLGFIRQETYCLMLRPPHAPLHQVNAHSSSKIRTKMQKNCRAKSDKMR